MKRLNIILSFLLSLVLSYTTVSGHEPAEKTLVSEGNVSAADKAEAEDKDASSILTSEETKSVSDLADNLGLKAEELAPILLFKVKDKNCALVPICKIKDHKDCFVRIFSKSDSDYMKYYLSGKLKTEKYVLN